MDLKEVQKKLNQLYLAIITTIIFDRLEMQSWWRIIWILLGMKVTLSHLFPSSLLGKAYFLLNVPLSSKNGIRMLKSILHTTGKDM